MTFAVIAVGELSVAVDVGMTFAVICCDCSIRMSDLCCE